MNWDDQEKSKAACPGWCVVDQLDHADFHDSAETLIPIIAVNRRGSVVSLVPTEIAVVTSQHRDEAERELTIGHTDGTGLVLSLTPESGRRLAEGILSHLRAVSAAS